MPIYLTQSQIDQITALKKAGPNAQGNYSHIYKFIGDLLPASDEKNWLRGAEQANAGQGVYSAMIRAYSQRQMELRGVAYSEALMQAASNNVATNALDDILRADRNQGNGQWTFPTMAEIEFKLKGPGSIYPHNLSAIYPPLQPQTSPADCPAYKANPSACNPLPPQSFGISSCC